LTGIGEGAPFLGEGGCLLGSGKLVSRFFPGGNAAARRGGGGGIGRESAKAGFDLAHGDRSPQKDVKGFVTGGGASRKKKET